MAAVGNEPSGAPPSDFYAGHKPRRILHADPSNYRRMIGGLVSGDTLVLAAGEYPRLIIANLAGVPGRASPLRDQPETGPPSFLGRLATGQSRSSIAAIS
jgi:hypothetical protein